MKLKESLDNVLDYEMQYMGMGYKYTFNLKEEFNINLKIIVNILVDDYEMFVNFKADGPDNELSTEKKASFAIFATLTEIIDEVVNNNDIENIEASGDSLKKAQIYEKLFKRFSENWEVDRLRLNVYAQKKD